MFNALKYTQEMERAGFTREQAEVSMKVVIDVMNENFATKPDLKELELALKSDVNQLRSEMKELGTEIRSEMRELESSVKAQFTESNLKHESAIRDLDYRLTIKLGTMMTVAIGATATLFRLLQSVH